MASIILQLTKTLRERPAPLDVPGIRLRNYLGPQDIPVWLELRTRAFARQRVGIANWDTADFRREFLDKPWWQPERMWFAEAQPLLMPEMSVGTVTLARRGEGPDSKPVVHWLSVVPSYRRRGIGHLLLAALGASAWDAGERQLWLETHSGWSEAVKLYEHQGWKSVDEINS